MPTPVVLTRVPADWLLRLVAQLRQIAIEIGRGDQDATHRRRLDAMAMELEPLAISYVERERLERGS